MFRELKTQGRLNQFVLNLQTSATNQMISLLEHAGLYHREAWEIVKDSILLPAEEDVPNLGETRQPYTD